MVAGSSKGNLIRLSAAAGDRLRRMAAGLTLIEGRRITYGELVELALDALDDKRGILARVDGIGGVPAPKRTRKAKG